MISQDLYRKKRIRNARIRFMTLLSGLRHEAGLVTEMVEDNFMGNMSQEVLLAALEYLQDSYMNPIDAQGER